MNTEHEQTTPQFFEAGRVCGADNGFYSALITHGWLFKKVIAYVKNIIAKPFHAFPVYERNTMPRWRCPKPVVGEENNFDIVLVPVCSDDYIVPGEDMLENAKREGISSGLGNLEGMLRNPEKINRFCENRLVSTERWFDPLATEGVFILVHGDGSWKLTFVPLDNNFGHECMLVKAIMD